MRSTHSDRLERWIGAEQLAELSRRMRGWYGGPIPLMNVPGKVYACGDGDFCGVIKGGYFGDMADYAAGRVKRILRNTARRSHGRLNTGFSSLSDLISEATTGGKKQDIFFTKTGTGAVAGQNFSLWNVGALPAAGGSVTARPGGAVPTNTTSGSFAQTNPGGSDTLHVTTVYSQASTAPHTLLVYDRLFHAGTISHTINTAQSISGVPTRYLTTESVGNFAFLEVTTLLGATASNVTMTYTDQAGNAAEAAAALAVSVSSAVSRIPHANWFIPLNAGDTGCRAITNLTMSAANTAGASNLVQGHPLFFLPQPAANAMVVLDGINSAFNLAEVKSGACLAMMELKGAASATTYTGSLTLVSG